MRSANSDIDLAVWRALGTRAAGDIVGNHDCPGNDRDMEYRGLRCFQVLATYAGIIRFIAGTLEDAQPWLATHGGALKLGRLYQAV